MTYVSPMGAYINTSNESVLSGIDSLISMLRDSVSVSGIDSLISMLRDSVSAMQEYNSANGNFEEDNINRVVSNSGSAIVDTAMKYLGYNESNGSYLKFTNGDKIAWCAAFVTYVVKETLGSIL